MKVKILDILKRLVEYDKKHAIYKNGEDNAYPERTERLINNSVTAKTAANIMTQYLIGKGFGEADNIDVNDNLKLIEFAEDVARDITENRGVFIHVNYNANFEHSSAKVIPFSHCRLGEKDDNDYNGKILVKKDWMDDQEKPKVINVYNPRKEVIKAQINAVKGIENYKGQIYYYNSEKRYHYPLSRIDAVMNDCDSEAQSAIYKNQLLRKGFFGRTVVITRPLIDADVEETIVNDNNQVIRNPLYLQAESEAKRTKDTIEQFLGADNAGGAMVMETDFDGDDLEKAIVFKNIENNIDPDLFNDIEEHIRENILIAFNNLPIDLIKVSSGLSNSGEAVLENKKMYWENTHKERNMVETIVNDIMGNFSGYSGDYLEIQPLIDDVTNQQNTDSAAQATE